MSMASKRALKIALHLAPCAEEAELKTISKTDNVHLQYAGRVALVTMTRTKSLNALCNELVADIAAALSTAEAEANIGCVVLTGSGKAFAAGADIKEMAPLDFQTMTFTDPFKAWGCVADCRLPVIAAVNGFAFGGGCEIAMMCDIILASEKATFGQPEIKLGIIPGAGGTQRLIRSVGKSKAMAWVLTGRNFSAAEAEKAGLAAGMYPADQLLPEAMKMAKEIAGFGKLSTIIGKEAVNGAYETTLKEGVHLEKKLFYSLFGTDDKKEGMDAFVNKRKAKFVHN